MICPKISINLAADQRRQPQTFGPADQASHKATTRQAWPD